MKRFLWISALILCCVCIAVFAQTPMTVKAENIDVTVTLNGDSLVSAYGEDFAYTNGKTVYVAKNNKVLSYHDTADFDRFISMAMNSTHIVLLAKKGTETLTFVYSYSNSGISKVPYINENLRLSKLTALYNDENGNLYALDQNFVRKFNTTDSIVDTPYTSLNGLFTNVTEFAVVKTTDNVILYLLIDGNIYEVKNQLDDETSLDEYRITSDKNFKDLTISNGKLICIDETCAYVYNSGSGFDVLLENGVGNHSVICATYDSINTRHCVYIKSDIFAINVYEYDGELNYYSSFDKTQFTHPTEYDSIALYKTTAEVTLYSSPRHLQKLALLSPDEYVLILSESGNFYYAYTYDATLSKAVYGYIKKQASISLCPAQTDTALGLYAQPLHPNTPIYEYPIDDRDTKVLRYASIRDQLVVIDNVGQDGAFSWGWYKVGCIDTDGNLVYGYVKQLAVSPYTSLSAPDLSKTAKLGAKKLGEYVKIYALPQEDSQVVAEVAEGSQIYLKNKFDKNSEWTQIIYEEKIAYVKTVNVSPSGLTSWQLALAITLPAVAVAITATVVILVVVKKRKAALKN
ncbi:MAG: hypothetical protein HDT29_07555 [Clostridiales bacterium]|nr:hypothetical protein [Clostridiales bacterium]